MSGTVDFPIKLQNMEKHAERRLTDNSLHQLLVLLSACQDVSSEVAVVNGSESCVGQYLL